MSDEKGPAMKPAHALNEGATGIRTVSQLSANP